MFLSSFLLSFPPLLLSLSVGVDRESHDALLLEVQRLEAELGLIRQDLQGVMGCRGKCGQLDGLQDKVRGAVITAGMLRTKPEYV